MYCRNALQKNSKSVSSTQVTILSLLPVETSVNVWLLMWSEPPGVRLSVQSTTLTLQAIGTWTGRHFLWLTSSNNNTWNSARLRARKRDVNCSQPWQRMAYQGFVNNSLWSFIHWSRSTLVVITPKISNYTRTRIELLYNHGFHPAGIFETLKSEGLQVSLLGSRSIKKLHLTGSAANLPRSGRTRKLFMEVWAFIDQQMRRNDETTSAKIRKKLEKCGILVSSSTVRRSRKQRGWTPILTK